MTVAAQGRVLAILIGVAEPADVTYPAAGRTYSFGRLAGVDNDLDWYAQWLGDVVQPAHRLQIIRPREPGSLTAAALKGAIGAAVESLAEGDLLVLVLSGHGIQVPDLDGDEELHAPGDRLDEAFVASDGLILDDFFSELWRRSSANGARAVCIIDTCHSETLTQLDVAPPVRVSRSYDLGLPRLFISAAESDQEALEQPGADGTHGVLTQSLMDAWQGHPGARTSYTRLFEEAAQLVSARSAQQPTLAYSGPRNGLGLLDEPPFGYAGTPD